MEIQVLVSAVEQNMAALVEKMNINTPAVVVNQCDSYGYEEMEHNGAKIQCFSMQERGVGLSRNTALLHADAEVCLFSDEDITLTVDYAKEMEKAYREIPDADMILFNVKVSPKRKTYWNTDIHRVNYRNYGRYPAYSISGKLDSLRRANVGYSLLFGGGAKYSNGEDSLFLHDCLKKGLHLYADTALLGEEVYRESTWFEGYHDKFFFDRGVLYHDLYGWLAGLFSLRFLWSHRAQMLTEKSFLEAFGLMKKGISEGKKRR